jgi:glycosyltransferase involved in cell wall biosynthesis
VQHFAGVSTLIDNPSLSVIIANYNNQKYIAECLDSVLNQTYRDLEILVVDDCSTDVSPDIIHAYASKHPGRIKTIYQNSNRGVSYSRNAAIVASTGKYITTLDSDDYYFNPEKLQNEMALIERHAKLHSKDICAFSNTVLVDADNTFLQESTTADLLREGDILEPIITRSCAIPRDFIMPRSAYFAVGGFDLSLNLYEDWDLKIRIASKYAFYYTGTYGTAYRRHNKGLSSAPLPEHVTAMEIIFSKNIHMISEKSQSKLKIQFEEYLQSLRRSIC